MSEPTDMDEAVQAAIAAIDVPEMGCNYTRGNIDDRDIRTIIAAAAPVLMSQHFGEFMDEIFTPVVKEHTHPPESCPCCQLYLAAQAKHGGGS